jgi:restriction endonuclease S subunit
MIKVLKDIAKIRSGIFCKPVPFGEIRYLQSTDYDSNRKLGSATTISPMVSIDSKIQKHILRPNEILFSAKGVNNYSVVYKRNYENKCIASSSFLVLTINNEDRILPEYLCWFLNNLDTMKTLKASSKGSAIQSISKSSIEDLEIIIPPMEKQRLIVEIDILLKEEFRIQNELNILKKQLLIKSIK